MSDVLLISLAVISFVAILAIVVAIKALSSAKSTSKIQAEHAKQVRESFAEYFAMLSDQKNKLDTQLTQIQLKLQHTETQSNQITDVLKQHQANQQQQLEVIKELNNKILLLEDESKANPLYTRAKKMIELGAGIEEVVQECELSRAEAELLISISKNHKSA